MISDPSKRQRGARALTEYSDTLPAKERSSRPGNRASRGGKQLDASTRLAVEQSVDDLQVLAVQADLFIVEELEAPKRRSAALRYPGSKWSLANDIVNQFGDHYHYVEPYFGSGAVFFTKPVSPHELINDMNSLVVNFFRVLRDRTEDLQFALEATPWSRDEYDASHVLTGDELEDARRFVTRIWQAHASDLAKKTGWKNRGSKQPARGMSVRWQRVPAELAELALRLKDAEIENRPAIEVIRRFATSDSLIYADPPYLMESRTQKMYAHEMSVDQHLEMLDALASHPGPVVISGYENSVYDKHLPEWSKVLVKPPKVEKQAPRMEVLWVKR